MSHRFEMQPPPFVALGEAFTVELVNGTPEQACSMHLARATPDDEARADKALLAQGEPAASPSPHTVPMPPTLAPAAAAAAPPPPAEAALSGSASAGLLDREPAETRALRAHRCSTFAGALALGSGATDPGADVASPVSRPASPSSKSSAEAPPSRLVVEGEPALDRRGNGRFRLMVQEQGNWVLVVRSRDEEVRSLPFSACERRLVASVGAGWADVFYKDERAATTFLRARIELKNRTRAAGARDYAFPPVGAQPLSDFALVYEKASLKAKLMYETGLNAEEGSLKLKDTNFSTLSDGRSEINFRIERVSRGTRFVLILFTDTDDTAPCALKPLEVRSKHIRSKRAGEPAEDEAGERAGRARDAARGRKSQRPPPAHDNFDDMEEELDVQPPAPAESPPIPPEGVTAPLMPNIGGSTAAAAGAAGAAGAGAGAGATAARSFQSSLFAPPFQARGFVPHGSSSSQSRPPPAGGYGAPGGGAGAEAEGAGPANPTNVRRGSTPHGFFSLGSSADSRAPLQIASEKFKTAMTDVQELKRRLAENSMERGVVESQLHELLRRLAENGSARQKLESTLDVTLSRVSEAFVEHESAYRSALSASVADATRLLHAQPQPVQTQTGPFPLYESGFIPHFAGTLYRGGSSAVPDPYVAAATGPAHSAYAAYPATAPTLLPGYSTLAAKEATTGQPGAGAAAAADVLGAGAGPLAGVRPGGPAMTAAGFAQGGPAPAAVGARVVHAVGPNIAVHTISDESRDAIAARGADYVGVQRLMATGAGAGVAAKPPQPPPPPPPPPAAPLVKAGPTQPFSLAPAQQAGGAAGAAAGGGGAAAASFQHEGGAQPADASRIFTVASPLGDVSSFLGAEPGSSPPGSAAFIAAAYVDADGAPLPVSRPVHEATGLPAFDASGNVVELWRALPDGGHEPISTRFLSQTGRGRVAGLFSIVELVPVSKARPLDAVEAAATVALSKRAGGGRAGPPP